jgi:hypothetical protein
MRVGAIDISPKHSYAFGMGQPDLFDRALGAVAGELRDVKIRAALTLRPRAVLEADPEGAHFIAVEFRPPRSTTG